MTNHHPNDGPTDDGGQLRMLFEDAVSDVHPTGGPTEIRRRARRPDSSGRWVPIVFAAAAATVVAIGGVAWLAGRQVDRPPTATPPGETGNPTSNASTQPDPGRTVVVPVYYVGRTAVGPRLFAEEHTIDGVRVTDLEAAVQEAIGRPPLDRDYQAWSPSDGLTAKASTNGSTITIDLSEPLRRPDGMDEEGAVVALQSLVWTATAVTAHPQQPVAFTVDGEPVPELLGIDATAEFQRASADSVAATVSVAEPAEGATVDSGFTVRGEAATFEANVVWELMQGDRVVREGFTTAAECCTLAPYSFTVTAPPGDYTLVVHDTDPSDGEGVGTSEDTKNITVQ